jgi:hypothetical protein
VVVAGNAIQKMIRRLGLQQLGFDAAAIVGESIDTAGWPNKLFKWACWKDQG